MTPNEEIDILCHTRVLVRRDFECELALNFNKWTPHLVQLHVRLGELGLRIGELLLQLERPVH